MGRQTWLADELRKAGIKVVEVSGWKTRGSDSFNPVGVTWHATAGSRNSTAQGEVNVILNGSTSAPPPIAQIMLDRDGTAYICAAGRCNHNKTGWAGPNKGLGNTSLIGIEMANDNRGEPWPAVQLEAARRLTAVIFRKLGTDPRKRLAAHFEHQPYAGRPAGEGSTKSDPLGVNMTAARAAVYAYKTNGWDDDVSLTEDMIPVSKTTGRELFVPILLEGEEVPASELLQLTAIWSKRAAEGIRVASDMIKIVADRDEVDETLLGQQITAALAPAVADRVAETLATLLEESGSLTPDQIREASAAGVREVLRQGVDDDTP
jgi:hypothetical protein